ncbi:helix-turn-helix domain-containing protein [Lactobacillus kimbladii]
MNLENENVHLEYKTAKNCLPKDFWRTYSAFANTDGGTVILGISEEKKFNYQIEGVINPDKIVNELITTLHNSNKVSCKLIDEQDIVHIIEDNKKLIKIKIHAANFDQKPVYINGNLQNSYIRENDGDFKVKPEQLKYMIANSYTHLDNQLLENYSVKDLNTQDIDQYRELLIKNTNDTSFKEQNYETFLFNIGAIRIDRKNSKQKKKLTTGCLLFFGKLNAIMDRFPGFQLDFYRKKNVLEEEWVTRISSGDMNFPEMNIFSFYTLVLEQLERGIPDKFIQDRNFTRGS